MNIKQNSVRAAAVLVAGLILSAALPASAQFKSQDGRALDSNRRVGSQGGNDEANDRGGSRVTGNQIVTGNVTGGREFRGPIFYRDPSEFHGSVGTDVSDRFVRDSSGPASRGGVDLNNPQAFYGDRRITPPPPGYVPTVGATGGYVAVQAQDPAVAQSAWAGGRMGIGVNQSFKSMDDALSQRFSELVLPGPSGDGTNSTDTFISASPLYGVRMFKSDPSTLDPSRPGVDQQGQDLSPLDRLGLSDRNILKMQDEMNNVNNPRPRSQQGTDDQGNPKDPNGTSDNTQGNGPRPIAQPIQSAVNADASGGVQSGAFNGSTLSPTARQRLLVAPAEQSELYRALEQQYQMQNANRSPNDLEAAHQIQSLQNVQRQAKEAADKKAADTPQDPNGAKKPAAAGATGAGAAGTGAAGTGAAGTGAGMRPPTRVAPPVRTGPVDPSGTDTKTPAQPVEPLNVDSLAAGVKAKGLSDLLKNAEDLMKQGKFTSAIQKYELASRVAPNNALITLGRAHAELGASLYGQAENDLRRSIQTTPALLMGRYNLRTFIGEERMGFLVKDLKEISEKDPKQLRPLLLLAYIAYNSGNKDQANDYLDNALKLASADPVLLAMHEHWDLKAKDADSKPSDKAPAPTSNK